MKEKILRKTKNGFKVNNYIRQFFFFDRETEQHVLITKKKKKRPHNQPK